MLADDLAAIFADAAATVPVVLGGSSTRGILHSEDLPQTDHAGDMVLTSQIVVTIRVGALPALARDNTLTVDGTSYRVRDIRHATHGQLLKVTLA